MAPRIQVYLIEDEFTPLIDEYINENKAYVRVMIDDLLNLLNEVEKEDVFSIRVRLSFPNVMVCVFPKYDETTQEERTILKEKIYKVIRYISTP